MVDQKIKSHRFIRCSLILILLFTALVIFLLFNFDRYVSQPRTIDQILSYQILSSVYEDEDTHVKKCNMGTLSLLNDKASKVQETKSCDPSKALLKVFMYDLNPKFHFGLLGWKAKGENVWPDIRTETPRYFGGLNLQHSVEYWLTLDLLSSKTCNAVRVANSSEADIVFVPFFSSLSYNQNSKVNFDRNKLLQEELVKFLKAQKEWNRFRGLDHVIVGHHPNSLLYVRSKLSSSMFILADFGRYTKDVANLDKDIVAPYKHLVQTYEKDYSGFDGRPTLIFFRGAIRRKDGGVIRKKLYNFLKDEPGIRFSSGSIDEEGIPQATKGMRSSKFCLHVAGDTPSSNRLFDAIASHCVPIIISDKIELPYEDVLDYSEFSIFVKSTDALMEDFLNNFIQGVSKDKWTKMWERLKEVDGYFEYQYPSKENDAVQMIWKAVARKMPAVKLKIHRWRRFCSCFLV